MLKSGITCYADMYFEPSSVRWAMEESGIRAVLGEGLVDNDGRGEVRLRNALREIDTCENDLQGRVNYALAPHAVYSCSGEYLSRIAAEAQYRGLPVHIHIAETAAEQERCVAETGMRVLPYLDSLGVLKGKVFGAHMIHLDGNETALAAARGVSAVHCPQSNMKLASGIFPFAQLKNSGVNMAVGTDGAASNDDLDLLEEVRSASLLQKVSEGDASLFGPEDALSMLTVNGARALGLDNQIGTLEPGKLADITILSLWRPYFYPRNDRNELLSHFLYGAKGSDVHTVIVNGQVCVSGGRCEQLDEGQIYHQVQRRAAKFWERVFNS